VRLVPLDSQRTTTARAEMHGSLSTLLAVDNPPREVMVKYSRGQLDAA
jgi:hypothetical protein